MRRLTLAVAIAYAGLAQQSDHGQDTVDRAHRPILQREQDRKKALAALTAEAAGGTARGAGEVRRVNYIDEQVFGRMKRDQVPHAPLASDNEFARRVWLDATGRIPAPAELRAFLDDKDAAKREKLIDKLVDSPAFVDHWTYYFEDLFRAGSRMGAGLNLFHYWVREWLRLDRPYNEVATDLLTGGGKSSFSVPGGLYFARDFVKAKDDPEEPGALDLVNIPDTVDEFTITYSKVFLGISLACIYCHDGKGHLEKVNLYLTGKKREDFYRQAGFFGRTRQIMNWENGYQANTEYTVDDEAPGYNTRAESIVRIPRGGGASDPRFLLSGEAPAEGKHQRDELARMLTSHVQFRRAFANRVWGELMGFGIVDPVDDFDLARYDPKNPPPAPWTIQPSNPALLDALAEDFRVSGHSFRKLVKRIMKSSAYQLSSRFPGEWKEEYASYYARKFVRPLTAAELHDAISLATLRPPSYPSGDQKVPMLQQMADPSRAPGDVKGFMKVFGQSNRDDMPKKVPLSAMQAMVLMQTKMVSDRVLALGNSRVEQLLKADVPAEGIVEQLYLATLSRPPLVEEKRVALAAIEKDRRRGTENLHWALINSPEFVFNY